MEPEFWRGKWRDGQLGWHQSKPHPMLVRNLPALGLAPGARVFAPLCGKSLDVGWLLAEGFRVVGAELVETAVQQLFEGLGVEPTISAAGSGLRYSAPGLDILVGDLFDIDGAMLGPVDAIYDRAALVALPAETRRRYAARLVELSKRATQLLITFDYDQSQMEGPPFSVPEPEVKALYSPAYEVAPLETALVDGGLKGRCPAAETAWLLR